MRTFSALLLIFSALGSAHAGTATLSINYGSVITTLQPERFYGNNVAYWGNDVNYNAVQAKVNATGSKFIRYPGGSNSNLYHWNGTGSYVGGIWQSNNTTWTPGFESLLSYRGSTSVGYGKASFLTDNVFTAASEWRSDTTTANAVSPYIYIDLATVQTFNNITLTWGAVFATSYNIQVSNGVMVDPPYNNVANNWVTVLAVTGATGGTDNRAIGAQSARWVRVEMLTSSTGAPNRDYRVREFEVFSNVTRRSVHNASASVQSVTMASPTSYQNSLGVSGSWHFDFEEMMTWIAGMTAPRPEPVISVNVGTGTPDEAAAWVYYANVVRGYNIKHWEVGNEMEGGWEYGGPVNAVYYANRFIQFATAMKAVDPTIKVHGPVVAFLKTNNELYDTTYPTFIDRFLRELQLQGQLGLMDIINFHVYAFFPNNNDATTLATPADWTTGQNYKAFIDLMNSTYYPGSPRENMMSEYNSGYDTNFTVKLQNALWLANWLGEYMKAFGSSGYAVLWDVVNGLNNNGKATWGDHAYLENGSTSIAAAFRYQERAHYWAMHMMRNRFTQDGAGNSLVAATSTQGLLPVYACKRPDGHLTLLVINKDPAVAYAGTINIAGFTPNSAATLYTFAGAATAPNYVQNYVWIDNNSANSYANPDLPPTTIAYSGAGSSFVHTFPAYSISVFDLTNANQTFTVTPTFTASPTITPTSTPVMAVVWEDLEQNQAIFNWNAGSDTANGATVTAYAISSAAAAVNSGTYGYATTMNTGAAGSWGNVLTHPSPYGTGPSLGYRDMTGMVWIEAWVKSSQANLQVRLALREAGTIASPINGADGEQFLSNNGAWTTLPSAGVWTLLSFPLSGFGDDPFYPYSPASLGNNTLNLGAISNVSVQVNGNQGAGISFYFDNIVFLTALGAPTMTATRSATPTRSFTPSPSPSRSPTSSSTPTPSNSPTSSASPSPSASPSLTATATGTATHTPSVTATSSATSSMTATRSASVTVSSTSTSSATPSGTRTTTSTPTASPSLTATPSATGTPTPSVTVTSTFTISNTYTSGPTLTFSVSPTISPTGTPSATLSFSSTPSPTYSVTATRSASITFSPTSTFSATPSDTGTPTPSATRTVSTTPTASPTPTPSPTPTASPSPTATPSPSQTPSSTVTPVFSPTASRTATSSPTQSETSTITPTPSDSATETPTSSQTLSSTPSRTVSGTPSVTGTPSSSATRSASPTASPSLTATRTLTGTSSASPTRTVTPQASATISPSQSPTLTASPLPSGTSSVSPSATRSPSPSPSPTGSGTASPSATLSPTGSGTLTSTTTSSPSATLSPTGSGTTMPSATPSPTHSSTPSITESLSPTLIATLAGSPAVLATSGNPPDVIALLPVPNPQSGTSLNLAFKLSAPADEVELRLYSRAMTVVSVQRLAVMPMLGWQSAAFDAAGLSRGSYYVKLRAKARGTAGKASKPVKLVWLP